MHAATQLHLDLPKGRPHAITPCLALKLEGPAPRLAADEREPQEGKGLWFTKSVPLTSGRRVAAELQQTGFLPMKLKRELLEPRSHRIPEAPRIGFMLETCNTVVGISHNDDIAGSLAPSPLLGPELENVVQVDVGEQW